MGYLRIEDSGLLLKGIVGNEGLHGVLGDVDLAVVNNLESIVDDAFH